MWLNAHPNPNSLSGGYMTIDERKKVLEGGDYWHEYVRLNGYAFRPSEEGLKRLSRDLDLNIPYLRKLINLYLEA